MRMNIFVSIAVLTLTGAAGTALADGGFETLSGIRPDALSAAELAACVGAADTFEHDGIPNPGNGRGHWTKTVGERSDANGKGLQRAADRADRGRSISFDQST